MLGPLFSAVEIACERLNKMLDAGRISCLSRCVHPLSICLLVAILPCCPGRLPKKKRGYSRLKPGNRKQKLYHTEQFRYLANAILPVSINMRDARTTARLRTGA